MTSNRPPWYAQLVLLTTATLFGFPLLWMVLCSLKSDVELAADPYALLPARWRFDNYAETLRTMPFGRYLQNTCLLCAGSVVGSVLSSALVAYGLARLRWPGRQLCFAAVIGSMLLPWHVTMIPRFLVLREAGLYNSLWALIVPTFLGDAFFIFMLRQFFLTIPGELSEAARIDGLSEWGIFWRIIVPLSKPALATVALFQLIASWNDFSGPLLYLNDPEKFPLAYGLERFVSSYSDQTHLLLAAATLFTLPMVIVFFLAQRLFVRGITTTGLK